MFEFFIALFGGTYYLGKYANDRAKSKAFDLQMQNRKELRELLRRKYEASRELAESVKEYICCGAHYDEICEEFAVDFRYILGEDWQKKIYIPNYRFYNNYWLAEFNRFDHYYCPIYWVYHWMLAKKGKIDGFCLSFGYHVGGIKDKNSNVRLVECIEKRLHAAGATDISFGLELHDCYTADRPYGGRIVIESLSAYPTCRLWGSSSK